MTKKDEGELNPIPNEKYEKFFAKFDEIDTLAVSQWKVAHLLGYFCQKWKTTYGADYHWKYNHQNPNKCFEVWQMNTLVSKLSANPQILKDYIDWVFANVVPKRKNLRSISFMTNDEIVIPYKMNVLLSDKKDLHIDRSTPLPDKFMEILQKHSLLGVRTYGEMAFLSQMAPMPQHVSDTLQDLKEVGFDEEILKRIV